MKSKLAIGLLVLSSLLSACANEDNSQDIQPNILFFLIDDQRNDILSCAGHPIVKTPTVDQLAAGGIRFTNAFVTTSICAASRASIITGLYESRHNYTFGKDPVKKEFMIQSYPYLLKQAGYRTGFIGKFGIKIEEKDSLIKEMFDYYKPSPRSTPHFAIMEDGSKRHSAEIKGDQAIEFINANPADQAFCLSVSFNAVHAVDGNITPGNDGHYPYPKAVAGLYEGLEMPQPDLSDPQIFENHPEFLKTSMNRERFFWRWDTEEKYQTNMRAYFRMISGYDRVMGRVIAALEEKGVDENTVIIYSADNGYYMGNRGFAGKWSHYEESIRVPMVLYDPRLPERKTGRTADFLVLNIDIPATILDLAEISVPKTYQGVSLLPIATKSRNPEWRSDFMIEHRMDNPIIPKYVGIRGERYVYANYYEQEPAYEFLHDLKKDPDELENLLGHPDYEEILKEMRGLCENMDSHVTLSKIRANFQHPPQEYGVNCWWWWLNGNVTKEGITKDLEAMKSRNFHGAMIFDAGGHNQRGNKDIPDGPLYGSKEWNELFVFALDEARRLGLEMGFNIQSGWNLGGPRVTPQYAAKQITSNGTVVQGGGKIIQKLEQPPIRFDFYEDIAILAIPLKDESQVVDGISDLSLKLGFHELGGSAPDCRFLLTNEPRNSSNPDIKPTIVVKQSEIIDLTAMLDASGVLTWDAPDGEWSVVRLGYTCTNSHVSTSSNQWQGLVLDYMSTDAFHFYWDDVVDPIFEAAGDHIGTTLKYMETDSWECGGMNWTDQFAAEFKKYRGYDILSYLPVLAGIVVDDIETSNAFLADFRKTLGDLVAYNHYSLFADYADKYDMGIQPESAGPHAGPMDGIKNYGFSEIVMSEFWSPSPHRPKPENRYFLKQASSAAHIYGKRIVGAESFTTIGPQWNDELWHDQKSAFDHEICAGLNRLYFHTFTASPKEMGLPGQEYFAGTHVNPQVTWWNQSGAFIDYMHRTQSLVQNGKFVADVLYYYGDHVPNVFSIKATDPAGAMPGYDYDVCDETILLQLKMKKNKIVVPGGIEYEVLVLPDHRTLSMSALKKVEELLKNGAQVIGDKPEQLVSRVGGEGAQEEFHALADEIWGGDNGEEDEGGETGEERYGKGYLAWGITAREYLLSKDIPKDFVVLDGKDQADFDYIHYTIDQADVYFITNQTTDRKLIDCQFRVSELQPELWDAITGEIREAKAFTQKDGLTNVSLTLEPYGAVFVVFSKEIKETQQGAEERNYHDFESLQTINGEWKVNFDPKWGPFDSSTLRPLDPNQKPGAFIFPELIDWTQHSHEAIKYYSGSAVYQKFIDLEFELKEGQKYYLQLGSVKDVGIAVVKVNGQDLGVTWTSPFRVDVSDVLKPGRNELEIKVINSWYNRVAGDEILELEQAYTSTNIILAHDFRGQKIENVQLEPSGLMGPVELLQEKQN